MLALLLVALSVGLDNFGASTALGVSGVDRTLRLRVALIFGVFEAAMPVFGLLLGHSLSHGLGAASRPIAGAVLGAAGSYVVFSELVGQKTEHVGQKTVAPGPGPGIKHLILLAAALSIDNLAIGFALGAYHVDLVLAAVTIAAVSVALSLLGLEIGRRLGTRLGQRSELVGGAVLILVGAAIGTGLF